MSMATAERKVNWFAIWVSVAVVVVLVGVGVAVWWGNSVANSAGEAPARPAVSAETGAIAVGEGPDTVDTYIDFMCPVCNDFEQTYGPTLEGLVEDGSITLNIHPISILDRYSSGTEYSTRTAGAAYCVAVDDPANALPFVQALFANQPAANSSGLTDDAIVALAQQAAASKGGAYGFSTDTYTRFATDRKSAG